MRDRMLLHKQDLEEERIQRLERRAKEKTAEEKSLKRSQDRLIHAICRYKQYYSSVCVRGDARQVNQK